MLPQPRSTHRRLIGLARPLELYDGMGRTPNDSAGMMSCWSALGDVGLCQGSGCPARSDVPYNRWAFAFRWRPSAAPRAPTENSRSGRRREGLGLAVGFWKSTPPTGPARYQAKVASLFFNYLGPRFDDQSRGQFPGLLLGDLLRLAPHALNQPRGESVDAGRAAGPSVQLRAAPSRRKLRWLRLVGAADGVETALKPIEAESRLFCGREWYPRFYGACSAFPASSSLPHQRRPAIAGPPLDRAVVLVDARRGRRCGRRAAMVPAVCVDPERQSPSCRRQPGQEHRRGRQHF